jgi:cell division protein FtsB
MSRLYPPVPGEVAVLDTWSSEAILQQLEQNLVARAQHYSEGYLLESEAHWLMSTARDVAALEERIAELEAEKEHLAERIYDLEDK